MVCPAENEYSAAPHAATRRPVPQVYAPSFGRRLFEVLKTGAAALERVPGLGPPTRDFLRNRLMALRIAMARRRGVRAHIVKQYAAVFGREPDLENPFSFNEKMQKLKLDPISPLHRVCADKIAVRQHVRALIGEDVLVPLHHVFDSPASLRPDIVRAERFVVKASHDSGSSLICDDRASFDWARSRSLLRGALSRDFFWVHGEPQYRDLPRRVLVEAYLPGAADIDYKVFCFHGTPRLIGVNYD